MRVDVRALVRAHQVHGTAVVVSGASPAESRELPRGDVIVARDPDVAIAIQTADCVPLLIVDRRTGAVAAAHAGWRGLAANVPRVSIEAMTREFGSRPEDLIAAVGPSVGPCCYEVGSDVRRHFEVAGISGGALERWFRAGPQPTPLNPSMPGLPQMPRPEHWFFDGWTAVGEELEAAGVPAVQIHLAELCTASHPAVLPSYRRDGRQAGRIAAAIRSGRPSP
jgi:purine-nucleoside/S-methyl-5'-thioadenosine phosphorylase / adenosine deaminase